MSWSPLLPWLRGGACSEPEASAQSGSLPRISLETQPCPPPAPLTDRSPERFPHPAQQSPPCVFREGRPSFPETPQAPHSLSPGRCPQAGVVKACFRSGCAVGAGLVSAAAGGQGHARSGTWLPWGQRRPRDPGPARAGRPAPRLPGVPQPHRGWLGACGPDAWPSLPPAVADSRGGSFGLVEPGEHGQMAGWAWRPEGEGSRSAADRGPSRRGLQGRLGLSPGIYRLCCGTITNSAAENTCSLSRSFCGPGVATGFLPSPIGLPSRGQRAVISREAPAVAGGTCSSVARPRPPWSWGLSVGTPQLLEVPSDPCHVASPPQEAPVVAASSRP